MKARSYIILFLLCSFLIEAQVTKTFNVVLRSNFGSDTMWDGLDVPIYSINSSLLAEPKIPARVIYCSEGDSVVLNALSLAQGEHHTVHLHGLDVDTRNDGDPMTSFWLEHLQDTTYSFKATHAGTYLYHCHAADVVHVQMGMYGMIIVKAAGGVNTAWTGGPAYDKEVHWLTSELDSSWHFNVPTHDPLMDTVNIPPYKPTYFLINGKSEWQLDNYDSVKIVGAIGQKIYLRLANIGYYNNEVVFPHSLFAEIIDSDGRPLPNSVNTDTVIIQPGERYGVMLHPTVATIDSIPIHYINMNTGLIENTQWSPLHIQQSVSVEIDLISDNIEIFPNPFSDLVNINMNKSSNEKYSMSVYDFTGKMVCCKDISENNFSFSTQGYSCGIYLIKIENSKGVLKSVKLVKSN